MLVVWRSRWVHSFFLASRWCPMGWSHATFWCQRVLRGVAAEIPDCTPESYLSDGSQWRPNISSFGWTVYIDNFICLGTDPGVVGAVTKSVDSALIKRGLPTHEQAWCATEASVLGWEFDGCAHTTRPSRRRAWRCVLALQYVLQQRSVPIRDLEKLIGQCLFLALIRREFLSVFRAVYVFINSNRSVVGPVRLWSSVRRELQDFKALIPFASAQWRREIHPTVFCFDASFSHRLRCGSGPLT
jgi:hypothetical protein